MNYRLLLVDGYGAVNCPELRVRMLREFPGPARLSVHFRPVRNDLLFESAKFAGELAYRVLCGEGITRSQLLVEYEVPGPQVNVMGRSADLLFALALVTAKWKRAEGGELTVAATGTLAGDGAVGGVERTAEKVAAAVRDLGNTGAGAARAIIFYPLEDAAAVDAWRAGAALPEHIDLFAVAHFDDALARLGYRLERVYLRNPFRGLEHFDYADHAIFFGRDAEIRQAVEQLLRRESAGAPGLLVEGASGSGKSSFLRAGVLHALAEPRFQSQAVQDALATAPVSTALSRAIWRLGLSDGPSDEKQIAASIAHVWAQIPEFQRGWQEPAFGSLEELAARRRTHWPAGTRFVWLIDQFEEILTRRAANSWLDAFGRFLKSLQADGVWTLASIRADATPLLKQHETLREVFGVNEGQFYLAALTGTALDAVIVLPARAADLTFEIAADGTPLDQRLREDAYREKDSLPVLQFTLNELYLKRDGRQLTHAAYEELGGLSGSIATAAQAVLASEDGDSGSAVQRLFRSLVSVDDSGRAARRYAPLGDVAQDPAQRRLLERLIEARLCVTDQREGQAVVAFAHDTLLHTLPALTEWLQRETGILQTRELALRDARSWQQHGESDDWLAGADKLELYQALKTAEIVLPDSARAFIERSARRLQRTRRVRRAATAVIATLAAGVVVASVAFALQARKAEQAADMAARRGEFLVNLLKSADPHGGKRDITVAEVLDASATSLDRSLGKEPLVEASMLGVITTTNTVLGRYDQGFAASDRQLALLRANGASNLEIARALVVRGELLRAHGRYADALAPLREAVKILGPLSGVEVDQARALNELGMALLNTRSEEEGEATLRKAIALDQRGTAERQAAAAVPMQNLAVLLGNQGRYEEALRLVSQAVELQRRTAAPDDPDILTTLGTYAAILGDLHRPAEAERIQREIVSRSTRILGPNHTNTLVDQVQLGDTLTDLRRYAEAETTLRAAAEALERNEGPSNRYVTGAWSSFSIAACEGGDANAGLEVARRIAEIRKQTLPEGDWHQLATQTVIGLCLVRLNRYAEAEPILSAARALESVRGPKFWMTQLNFQASRELYAATGRAQEAAQMASKITP
jgi:tetratricopeptide (TPR) repeat protein